jgi:DNA-directed RNA polymerase specialized sigma24 family protein
MPEATHAARSTPYASSDDFCRIFNQEMDGFYLLSFLLTGDREKAEQCFVSGLEDSIQGNPVFKEWARSWARRAVIQNAVRAINPRPAETADRSNSASLNSDPKALPAEREEIAAVLELGPFERFVYVLSILERYSDQDCSVLLGCARRDVLSARSRALQQIGRAVKLDGQQLSNADSGNPASRDRRTSVLESLGALRLAPSV